MQLTNRARLVLTMATVAFASLALTTGAGASVSETPSDPDVSEARVERACARVPKISERVDGHIAKLTADAETKGSLAWLGQKIETATEEGREQRAEVLQVRLTVRTSRLELLQVRATALDELQVMCDEHAAS